IMGEISAASMEQSQGIEQVNTTVTQLDEMTQQNSALVEQAAAAAGSMEDQARVLSEAVSAFRLRTGHGVEQSERFESYGQAIERAGNLTAAPHPRPLHSAANG